MLKLQKSSLILILIIVVLTVGCVSIYTLGYTPGTVWHKAEDVKSGTFGQNVGKGNYNFPDNIDVSKQVTAGTMFKVGSSELSSSQLKVNGSSLVVTSTGNVGIGTLNNPQTKLEVNGAIKIGTQDTCNTNTIGAIRYNSTLQQFEGCNGSSWELIASINSTSITPRTCGTVTFTYKGSIVTYGTVIGADNRCWLDRNLGASRVALSLDDSEAYGDLFQWGRLDDGHQNRNSDTTTTLSSSDIPGHSNFIRPWTSPFDTYDWRAPQNDNLWQGVNGTNNPCPPGWRIPTRGEWELEIDSWGKKSTVGAYESPLKMPAGGARRDLTGEPWGAYEVYAWTSSVSGMKSYYCHCTTAGCDVSGPGARAFGVSVRCIKDFD